MIQPDKLATLMRLALDDQDRYGPATWQRVTDWQRWDRTHGDSNRGGGVGNGKTDDALARQREDRHAAALKDELATLTARLDADLRRLRSIHREANPTGIPLERVNMVPACIVCAGPAIPVRRGMCDACRKAFDRSGIDDLTMFKQQRLRHLEEAQRIIHEHEAAS